MARSVGLLLVVAVASACGSSSPGANPVDGGRDGSSPGRDASPPDGATTPEGGRDGAPTTDATRPALESGADASPDAGPPALAPMPVISRGAPAFASSGTATDANDASYDTMWRSNETTSAATPSWLAYDLSSVPVVQRGRVDVVWYGVGGGYAEYDLNAKPGAITYNEPRDYTIEGNAAAGGALPTAGWVTLVTVTGNTYISSQHPLDLTGYNWVRFHVTAINGTTSNLNTSVNLDVHDASNGVLDSWLFLGDSITAFALRNDGAGIGAQSFAELVNAAKPEFFPAEEGAGEGGWTSGTALAIPDGGSDSLFDTWLMTFPGRYVCLSYGTNDGADTAANAMPTYNNFVTMVTKVIAAGKIPCVPHVPWATDAPHQTNAQLINAQIDMLYAAYPMVVKGPDLYGVLQNHPELYQDSLHPNPQGREVYRQAWATAMTSEVYP
jgi:hypothetical protein